MTRRRTTEQIRAAVIDAAADIIEEIGPLRFRMADLFQRAGVSESVVYRHFIDRDHLVNETLLSMFAAEVERARDETEAFTAWLATAEAKPEVVAGAVADWFMPPGDPDTVIRDRALKLRLVVAALEYPEVRARAVRLQRELSSLTELRIARVEEHLAANGWAVSLHSMRMVVNGFRFGLLLEDLDGQGGGTPLTRDELVKLFEAIFVRFAGRG
jgi:AcrR family transcriptional regulator